MRVLSGLGLVAVLSGVALAACSGDDDGGGSASTGGSGGADAGGTGGTAGEAGDVLQPLAAVCVKSPAVATPAGDAACPAKKPAAADALDDALGKAGIDRCGYGFSDATMAIWKPIFADDAYQLPSFRPLHQGLLRIPAFALETEGYLDAALDGKQTVSSVLLAASVRKGHTIDACAELGGWESALAAASPLAAALAKLGAGDAAALAQQTQGVPLDLQQALVPVLATLAWAAGEVRAAVGTEVPDELDFLSRVYSFVIIPTDPFTVDKTSVGYLKKVDEKRIATAAALVARAVEAADLGKFAGKASSSLAVDTPLGAVVIGGPSADSYTAGHLAEKSALLLELGGDDTYEVPVGSGRRELPVGVAIDLAGKDHYGYAVVPDSLDTPTRPPSDSAGRYGFGGAMGQTLSRIGRQGSGILGVGLAWDLGVADDVYASLALSQGAGALGVGALFDQGGADKYVAENTSQGSAMWGIGALIDAAGNDEYRTFYASQGFGYVHGVGVAVDGGGDDTWFADPGDPKVGGDSLYPSAQLPKEGNTSMCQGAGFGRRDDTKGLYMAGGHGVLYDRAGKDSYTASVFAQGSGYWLGFGLLTDKAGDDTYKGLWYVQGGQRALRARGAVRSRRKRSVQPQLPDPRHQHRCGSRLLRCAARRSGRQRPVHRAGALAGLRQLAGRGRLDQPRRQRSVRARRKQHLRLRVPGTRRAVHQPRRHADLRHLRRRGGHRDVRASQWGSGGRGRRQLEPARVRIDGRRAQDRAQRGRRSGPGHGRPALSSSGFPCPSGGLRGFWRPA